MVSGEKRIRVLIVSSKRSSRRLTSSLNLLLASTSTRMYPISPFVRNTCPDTLNSPSTPLIFLSTPGTLRWILRMRCTLASGLIFTSGRLTHAVVIPSLIYRTIFPATSTPMANCASWVLPPMCGLKMVLEQFTNAMVASVGSEG